MGALSGVKLAIAYDAADAGATHIEITPSTTKGYGGFTDVSVPVAPGLSAGVGGPGTVPKLGDGSNLPSHGIYGAGVAWSEYLLGDFDKSDSPSFDLADLAGTSQTDIILGAAQKMQINVYDITITGTEAVHFDLYDHYQSESAGQAKSKSVATFAPFSHDAEATEPISPSGKINVPDASGTAILLAMALVAVGGCSLRFRRTA